MQLFRGRRGISHEGGEAGREVIPQSPSQRHQPAGSHHLQSDQAAPGTGKPERV